ncbi:hypothetical protein [Methylobacterium sp. PvR107]|uniref:COG4315 family predicted lipoprotein n=1 Tax=Methylobacterium sp. PvR107 TaxID=2806597 RepID=UPI001AEB91FB|nr:hypothetical protein [Methylobacterium sp. PvR107]MBP1181170.1 putative lipoprotein with Yx(FWY)xxD motif [Methylobacterium sp. PvR107]
MRTLLIRTAFVAFTSSTASAQPAAPATQGETSKGPAWVDAKGMTLYTFDKDVGGKSMCNGRCAENWPPLTAASASTGSGDWTTVTRDDGTAQRAFKGKSLDTWTKDTKSGDITGDGFLNGAWHIAKP